MKSVSENKGRYKSEVDVAVLLLYFTRTDLTKRTFEQIRKARPARIYLYQDGPRDGRQDDINNIVACRKAIEDMIDWDCEIHRFYQERNFGCDPSEYISQKWMFETEEKGIIIEDDDVMAVSFFRFCKELLDKYENDERIKMICGMNHLGIYEDCPYDYFFVRAGGAIWGWATWKRVIDKWDPKYEFLKDKYSVSRMYDEFGSQAVDNFLDVCSRHLASGREHYESILGAYTWLNIGVNIVPTRNMTCNIGIAAETTHSVSDINKLPRATRRMLYMKIYDVNFPLKHPKYIQADYIYWKKVSTIINGNWFERFFHTRKIESIIYRIFPFLGKE